MAVASAARSAARARSLRVNARTIAKLSVPVAPDPVARQIRTQVRARREHRGGRPGVGDVEDRTRPGIALTTVAQLRLIFQAMPDARGFHEPYLARNQDILASRSPAGVL
jgi:hypothetical protein